MVDLRTKNVSNQNQCFVGKEKYYICRFDGGESSQQVIEKQDPEVGCI
jgi:hypothetical protein